MQKTLLTLLLLISPYGIAADCETHRQVFFENKDTKVWQSTICPHEKLAFHVHQFARILIPAESGQIKVVYESGEEKMITLVKNHPIYLDKAQGKDRHQDINPGNTPLHVTLIELRKN